MSKAGICLVTPDLSGPMTNGGIGTAIQYLARFARQQCNLEVDILLTGEVSARSAGYWKDRFREELGIELFCQDDLPALPAEQILDSLWVNTRSMQVHDWLKHREYRQIHFQDYQANGFVAMQSKRAGLAYQNTLLTCTLHSSIEWMKEGNGCFAARTIEEMVQQYMEHYCVAHADLVISPTRYMVDWIRPKVPQLPPTRVIQNLYKREFPATPKRKHPVRELCFFGRLESRKGLEIFTTAIERLAHLIGTENLPRITFLGRPGNMSSGEDPLRFIRSFHKRAGISCSVMDRLSADEAVAYLTKTPGLVAVLPSTVDNLPYVVVECLQEGIPFIASRVGGIPELVLNDEALFDPDAASLRRKLVEILDLGVPSPVSGYDRQAAESGWAAVFEKQEHPAARRSEVLASDVTICVPYYNYPAYLPELLASLERQTVSGFQVVVVNDGSTDEAANKVFAQLAEQYGSRFGWIFVETENRGICAARNHAASLARTDYLLFMDADNLAEPEMVQTFATSVSHSNLDCVTCYGVYFSEAQHGKTVCHYRPVGPCLGAGLYYNTFGDANFIVCKKVFERLGGFAEKKDTSYEDWEFLANLCLSGFRQDVLPKTLFRYRFTESGFSRNTSRYRNFRRIIDCYGRHLPSWAVSLLLDTYSAIRLEVYYAFPPPNIGGSTTMSLKRRFMNFYRIEHHEGRPRVALRLPFPMWFVPLVQRLRGRGNR